MLLEGFVEAVDQFQIRGWALDPTSPNDHLNIEIFLDEELLASSTASLFRDDLKQAGLGEGDHAFIVNLVVTGIILVFYIIYEIRLLLFDD